VARSGVNIHVVGEMAIRGLEGAVSEAWHGRREVLLGRRVVLI
jgi:hypothetical protein